LEQLTYEHRWQLSPRAAACGPGVRAAVQVGPAALADHTHALMDEEIAWQAPFMEASDAACAAYAVAALRRLGADLVPGERFTGEELAERLGIAARHRRLLARFLDWFAEDGWLLQGPEGWEVVHRPPEGDLRQSWADLLARHPAFLAELLLLW